MIMSEIINAKMGDEMSSNSTIYTLLYFLAPTRNIMYSVYYTLAKTSLVGHMLWTNCKL
jgi:hypothetical protein